MSAKYEIKFDQFGVLSSGVFRNEVLGRFCSDIFLFMRVQHQTKNTKFYEFPLINLNPAIKARTDPERFLLYRHH